MDDPTAPARIQFDTGNLPERDRFPAVREEFARQLLTVDCMNRSEGSFAAKFDIHRVGRLAVAYVDTAPAAYVRTPELIRDGQDALFATLSFTGTLFCSQRERGELIKPGDAVLLDAAYARGIHFDTDTSYVTVRVPRTDIARAMPSDAKFAGMGLDRNPAARQLLFAYLRNTRDVDLNGDRRVAQLYDEHIYDLIVLALGAGGDAARLAEERGVRAARRVAILRAIEGQSMDPSLSATAIALRFGITPRYVHLLLEETGKSFSRHVLEQRLQRAATLLCDPVWRDRKVADIAIEAGFADLSYFNRAFRRHFGATPSDIRAASLSS